MTMATIIIKAKEYLGVKKDDRAIPMPPHTHKAPTASPGAQQLNRELCDMQTHAEQTWREFI